MSERLNLANRGFSALALAMLMTGSTSSIVASAEMTPLDGKVPSAASELRMPGSSIREFGPESTVFALHVACAEGRRAEITTSDKKNKPAVTAVCTKDGSADTLGNTFYWPVLRGDDVLWSGDVYPGKPNEAQAILMVDSLNAELDYRKGTGKTYVETDAQYVVGVAPMVNRPSTDAALAPRYAEVFPRG